MSTPAYDAGRLALMLNELRLPTIARLWPEFAERSDKEGWQATRLIGALLEHELAERAKRRIERHRAESHLDPTLADAILDRLVHNTYRINLSGESMRKRKKSLTTDL